MASKKDKFGKKVRRSLKKSLGDAPARGPASPKDSKEETKKTTGKNPSSQKPETTAPSPKPSGQTDKTEKKAKPKSDEAQAKSKKPILDSFALYGFSPKKAEASKKQPDSPKGKNRKDLGAKEDGRLPKKSQKTSEKKSALPTRKTTSPEPSLASSSAPSSASGEDEPWLEVATEEEFGLPRGSHKEKSQKSYEEKPTRRESTMPRNRDSIYNVSTDIRLEDYTEDSGQERDYAGMARFAAGVLLVALLAWGGYEFSGLLFAPDYQIAITNEEVDAGAVEALDQKENIVLTADRPVFIRFQWPEGSLTSDYLRIRVLSAGREVAVMGRMAPVTVNYILFAGSLEPGKYEIVVENRDGTPFLSRKVTIR